MEKKKKTFDFISEEVKSAEKLQLIITVITYYNSYTTMVSMKSL